nr:tetratricopeptide repeat protein [Acidobacteriota bacterium]
MNRTIGVVVVMLFSIAWHPAAMRAQSAPEVTLRAALELEQIKGDLKGAIELYKKVVDGADRAAGAKALLRMAECYQNLGDKKANKAYERLVRDFGDQREAAVARTRLREPAAMSKGDRAVWTGQHVDLFGTISPDGRYLTYIDWESTGNLMVRDLVANTDRALTNNVKHSQFGGADWSSISRDGTQVAYSWWHAGGPPQFEVRVAPLMGSGIPASRVIWRGSGRDSMRPFDWSPDGRSLLVLVEREDRTSQLGIVNVAAGTVQVLKSLNWRGISKAVFSADGRHIAYDVEAGDGSRHSSVFIMAVDASRDLAAVAGPTRN